MPNRRLPVRPNLDQLKHQAKDLLRAIRAGDPSALADLQDISFRKNRSGKCKTCRRSTRPRAQLRIAKLAAPRAIACKLIDAIWRDDIEALRAIVTKHPKLIHESALITDRNWGLPMSYAANLGRDAIIKMLYELGARDLEHALDRATLQSKIGTAKLIHELMGAPPPPANLLDGAAYTLSASGTAVLFEMGVQLRVENGKRIAPVAVVLETDSRKPAQKHEILEMYVKHGVELPDTPPMASSSRPNRSARKTFAPRSESAIAHFHSRRNFSAGTRLSRRNPRHARHSARRRNSASHVRRLQRNGNRALAVSKRNEC